MEYFLYSLLLIVGIGALIFGGNFFVSGASNIAKKAKVSPIIIGLTIVALGTSLPELAVSIFGSVSAFQQRTTADIALGNIVGSNISNITLVLGFSLLFCPVILKKSLKLPEVCFLCVASILIILFCILLPMDNLRIERYEAAGLILVFIIYMVMIITITKKQSKDIASDFWEESKKESKPKEEKNRSLLFYIMILILGGVLIVGGGIAVTKGAEEISIGILNQVFSIELSKARTLTGLTVVAIGTSLPELVTTIIASKKKENELALGNIVGSNIFNTLFIAGVAGLIVPLGVNRDIVIDFVINGILSVAFLLLFFFKKRLGKIEGVLLLVLYAGYLVYIVLRALYL